LNKYKYLPESKKADLEKEYLMVESEHFKHITYAIDRQGKGIQILQGRFNLPVAADNLEQFLQEIREVWQGLRPRKGV
jgi:hypothetical protein